MEGRIFVDISRISFVVGMDHIVLSCTLNQPFGPPFVTSCPEVFGFMAHEAYRAPVGSGGGIPTATGAR